MRAWAMLSSSRMAMALIAAAAAVAMVVGVVGTQARATAPVGPGLFATTTSAPTTSQRPPASTPLRSTTTLGPPLLPGTQPDSGSPLVGVVPPEAAAIIAGVRRTGPNNTGALLLALEPLVALGLRPVEPAVVGMGRFPVAGYASWQDDWLEPRFGADGAFHFHQGNDVLADCGLPIRSPTDGVLVESADPAGGWTVVVRQADGTYFYLAHLSAYVLGVSSGQRVRTGDVIGFVGRTGSATGCHVHLEIHPLGGPAVDPKPYIDAWVEDAIADAPGLIGGIRRQRQPVMGAAQARLLEWESDELAATALLLPTTPAGLRPLFEIGPFSPGSS